MEILISNKNCIITPFSPILDKREFERMNNEINKNSCYSIGLDLSFVKICTNEFLILISKLNNLNLYNVQSDLLVLINIMGLDKKFNIFTNKLDFLEQKHRLLNRKFNIVK